MLILEQVESLGKKELEQQGYSHSTEHPKGTRGLQSNTVMQECVDERMKQDILDISRKISNAHNSYNDAENLPIGEAVTNVANGFLESIKDAKEKKVILSVPANPGRGSSVIDSLIYRLNHLMNKDDNVKGDNRGKLEPIWSEICSLVSKGNYVSEAMSKLLPNKILEERDNYLSGLKQIVSGSIENDKKEGIAVERDNGLYYIQCPEDSVITIQNGQYCDMKGKVKMTFKVGDDEKIEMILSSENALGFGKIMVHMDDKSCEIFSKYLKDLETEPRISKVVEAAKSFVQNKPPLSSVDNANVQQLQSNVESLQSSGQSLG